MNWLINLGVFVVAGICLILYLTGWFTGIWEIVKLHWYILKLQRLLSKQKKINAECERIRKFIEELGKKYGEEY